MQPTPSELLGIAALLAFASIGTAEASTTTSGTTGPLTTFLKSLTTATNPPSTAQPTTPPPTTRVTTGQATGTTIQSATTVVALPTTSRETTTDSVTTPLRQTTIPKTATPSTIVWASTTQSPTTQLPTTQLPTTQSPTTQSPTTQSPTTQSPTTQSPTTRSPTTRSPTTRSPTTRSPTSPSTIIWPSTTPSTATDSTTITSTTSSPTAIPTTTAPCADLPNNVGLNAAARPTFNKIQKAYPTYDRYPLDAKRLIKDMEMPPWVYKPGKQPDTCAARMTKAFLDAGLVIDRGNVQCKGSANANAGDKRDGKQYIVRVLYFRCYLKAIWGKPDICDGKNKEAIKGKKGILVFTECIFKDKNGKPYHGQHIDLWDGNSCTLGCKTFFDKCKSVELYILP